MTYRYKQRQMDQLRFDVSVVEPRADDASSLGNEVNLSINIVVCVKKISVCLMISTFQINDHIKVNRVRFY